LAGELRVLDSVRYATKASSASSLIDFIVPTPIHHPSCRDTGLGAHFQMFMIR
jgi:hypothetical protein